MSDLIPIERIENKILVIRGQKVLLDRDLAELYGIPTKALKQAVKRNIEKFPEDFMFELNKQEFSDWRSQIVTSIGDKMGLRYMPMPFTEYGVVMLSTVLRSKKAVQVNIMVVRAFIRMREMLLSNEKMANRLKEVEERMDSQEMNTIIIMDKLRTLTAPEKKKQRKIGFSTPGAKKNDK